MKPRNRNPDRSYFQNISQQVEECKEHLNQHSNGTYNLGFNPTNSCSASFSPPGSFTAESPSECESYGREANQAAQNESQRLLAHEQVHFEISCGVAEKANWIVDAGVSFDQVEDRVDSVPRELQDAYDSEITHGCDESAQNDWENNYQDKIDNELSDLVQQARQEIREDLRDTVRGVLPILIGT